MTGYARAEGEHAPEDGEPWTWSWEMRSVNARGLDLRLRVPSGADRIEPLARRKLSDRLGRGSVSATLVLSRETGAGSPKINRAVLNDIISLQNELEDEGLVFPSPPRLDTLLSVRGILENEEQSPLGEDEWAALSKTVLTGLDQTLDHMIMARAEEGARMADVLAGHLDTIDALCIEAGGLAATQPETLRRRFQTQLTELLELDPPLPEERLAQELALLSTKADVREELDRLASHIEAARDHLGGDGPVGRKLDFLCQELNREANTLCSKSIDMDLTRVGLDLKSTIEQFREQVQNVE